MLRLPALLVLVLFLAACGCAGLPPAREVQGEMASVVLVNAMARADRYTEAADGGFVASKDVRAWSGTGVVIGEAPSGETYVLTAGHVARTPEVERNTEERWIDVFTGTEFQVMTLDGKMCPAVSVKSSEGDVDLGLLRVQCKIGVPARYEGEPAYGEPITTVGCPSHACESFNRSFFVGDGRWLTKYKRTVMTSLPAWMGASGSPVFHDGRLVGIIYAVDNRFSNISYVVPISEILKFIEGREGG